jgi:GNAT superfamily N-acetyltransferase
VNTADVPVLIRPGEKQDVGFLRDLVRHTDPGRSGLAIDEEPPPLSRYVAGWGRHGDAAVIALDPATHAAIGAAWFRLFTADEPGFGFVDEATPEMTFALVPSRRGEGIGSLLLDALVDRAREDGFAQVSLASQNDPAWRGVFEKHGFEVAADRGSAVTMTLDLA